MPTLTNVLLHSDFGIPTSSTIPSLRKQPTFRKTPALVFESLFDAKAFKSISVEVALVFPRKWHLMWCHYPDLGPACFWLVENLLHPIRSNQKCYPNLGSDTSSVWSFCARFSDVIWRGNQWWLRQMSAVFSGYYYPQPVESRTDKHFFLGTAWDVSKITNTEKETCKPFVFSCLHYSHPVGKQRPV